jgi:cytidylate kinase
MSLKNEIPILTIDGPSGVGKGTIAKIIAQKTKWNLLDSGAIYRIFAFLIDSNNINIKDLPALEKIAKNINIKFVAKKNSDLVDIYLDNNDISSAIRNEKIGILASKIAVIPEIRKYLLIIQKNFIKEPGLVADGRDMGTTVFPNAKFKIFLTATETIRANRRLKQLQKQNIKSIISDVLKGIKERDERDYSRKHSPLKQAQDALIVDTTDLTINEVVAKVMKIIEF